MDLTALGEFSVKEGFAKYGAKAVFDSDRKLLFIHVCTWNKDVYPPEEGQDSLEEWNYAKWVSTARLQCTYTCDAVDIYQVVP